jgi:hypothetical protein
MGHALEGLVRPQCPSVAPLLPGLGCKLFVLYFCHDVLSLVGLHGLGLEPLKS